MRLLQQAEQVAREVVATRPEIDLKDVELVSFPTGPVLVVSIESPRRPMPERITRFEALLQERLGEQSVRVVVRLAQAMDITSKGRVLFGQAHFATMSAEEAQRQQTVEETELAGLQSLPDTFVTAVDALRRGSGWAARAEVVAPRVLSPSDVRAVEEGATKTAGEPVEVTVRASTDVLVTGKRYQVVGDVRRTEADRAAPAAVAPE